MSGQKFKNKVEMWTSKIGIQYQKDDTALFNAAKAELDSIRSYQESARERKLR